MSVRRRWRGIRAGWPPWLQRLTSGLGVAAILIALIGSAYAYQLGVRSKRPPSFARGSRAFGGAALQTPSPGSSPAAPGTATPGAAGTITVGPTPEGTVVSEPRGTPVPTGRPTVKRPTVTRRFPITGAYIYNVKGHEEATGFGGRDFPPTMTMTVSRPKELSADEVQFDLEFSNQHEEREIVAYRDDGIYFTFESGSVTFSGFTQSSQADYKPPMLQIPLPLKAGVQRKGHSDGVDPRSGSTSRTEDWTVKVLRREAITIIGETVNAWVVRIDRQSRPGGSEDVTRTRTYWFDPDRKIWVKWTEKLHGQRRVGITFTYDEESTVTLAKEPS